jgi:hypothetical protein
MPRHQLSKVKYMVKPIAQKYNIPYHDTTVIGGTIEVLQSLDIVQKISQNLSKKML